MVFGGNLILPLLEDSRDENKALGSGELQNSYCFDIMSSKVGFWQQIGRKSWKYGDDLTPQQLEEIG